MNDMYYQLTSHQSTLLDIVLYESIEGRMDSSYTDLIERLTNTHIKDGLPSHDTLVLLKESALISSTHITIESLKAIYAFMVEWYFYGIFNDGSNIKLDFNNIFSTYHKSSHKGVRGDIAISAYDLLVYLLQHKQMPNSMSMSYLRERFNEYCREVGRSDLHIPMLVGIKFDNIVNMLEYVISTSNRYSIHQTKTLTRIIPNYIDGLCSTPEIFSELEGRYYDTDCEYYDEED